MILITKELAVKIEGCIKKSHYQYTRSCQKGAVLEVGSGAAFFSGKDSFFSQVIGWGFTSKDEEFSAEIEAIEAFYRQHQHSSVDIELSPLTGRRLAQQLSLRGYLVAEMNNISILDLSVYPADSEGDSEEFVQEVSEADLSEWAHRVALGFEYEPAKEQFYLYGKTPGVIPFAAYIDGQLAAGGTIAIHDGICDLGVTSTLPDYRGQGLQKILIKKRLRYALQAGAEIATVTTEPGSISDLNVQKMGFKIAYTRIKFSKST